MANGLCRGIPRSPSHPPHHLPPTALYLHQSQLYFFSSPIATSDPLPHPRNCSFREAGARNYLYPPLLVGNDAFPQHFQEFLPLLGPRRPEHRLLDLPPRVSNLKASKFASSLSSTRALSCRRNREFQHSHYPAEFKNEWRQRTRHSSWCRV